MDNDCVGEITAGTILKMLAMGLVAVGCIATLLLMSGCTTTIPQGESDAVLVARTQADAAIRQEQIKQDGRRETAKLLLDAQNAKTLAAITNCGNDANCGFVRMTALATLATLQHHDATIPVIVQQAPIPQQQVVMQAPRTGLQQAGDILGSVVNGLLPWAGLWTNYRTGIVQSNNNRDTALSHDAADIAKNGQNTGAFVALGSQNHGSSVINNITNGSGAVNTGGGSANSSTVNNTTTGSYNPNTGGLKYCWPATAPASGVPGYPAGCVQ